VTLERISPLLARIEVAAEVNVNKTLKTLSILCPVYNEEGCIALFLDRIAPVIGTLKDRFEVRLVFLDNHSTDRSNEMIHEIIETNGDIFVIRMSRNVGYQKSLETGLRMVDSDLYAFIDVDCEDPPEMLLRFAEEIEGGRDLVYGIRTDRPEPDHVKWMRRTFYRILNGLSDEESLFLMAEFAMFTREVRDSALAEINSFPFIRSSLARVGFDRVGLPYVRQKRIAGTTNYNLAGMTVFAVAGILASTTFPLRLPIYLLPFWFLLVTAFGILAVVESSAWWALATFLLAIAFIGGSIAAMALYVARTYKNSFARPNAHIQTRLSRLPPTGRA
jgi:polyisoprenyl-phosphate glycosyltransferase